MARFITTIIGVGLLTVIAMPLSATAQSLGTFRWQLQPYCNIVSVLVTQNGSIYRVEGTDDQCAGGNDQASVIGTAFLNPDGTIGFGLNIVTSPGGRAVPIDAAIDTSTLSGTWRDSAGNSGTFRFTPGAGTGGSPRPTVPIEPSIPTSFVLNQDGGFVARGTFGTGNIPASGLGARMMWHPAKAAFRAGEATIPVWDDGNVGVYSTAFGFTRWPPVHSASRWAERIKRLVLGAPRWGTIPCVGRLQHGVRLEHRRKRACEYHLGRGNEGDWRLLDRGRFE